MPDLPPGTRVGPFPFREAIAFLKGKLDIPTGRWDEMLGEAHAKGFTVAGATKGALLGDLHQAVNDAIEQGQSIGDFRKAFDSIVQEHGWSYKGKRGWRTRVIYDTNLRTAHASGRWQKIRDAARREQGRGRTLYLQYLTVGDSRVRPEHAQWHQIVLPADDPFWDTHYPPNGWGCRCIVRILTERQMARLGIAPDKAPPIRRTERINTTTGEIYGKVPDGIDTGWDYNVGQAWLRYDQAGHLPDSFGSDHAHGAPRHLQLTPGQRTWKDYGLAPWHHLQTQAIPALLPEPETKNEALGIYRTALGLAGLPVRDLQTPGGQLVLHDQLLAHLTAHPPNARRALALAETLRNPEEIWATAYPDGIRRHYLARFRGENRRRSGTAIVRINTDSSLHWTWTAAAAGTADNRRRGGLIYSR